MGVDDVITERLIYLRNEVQYLKTERDRVRSLTLYAENTRLRKAVERALQGAVEICLDIGRRIIALERLRYPEDNQDVFTVLSEGKILSPALLPTMQDMVRFRNLVVHEYTKIDDAKVYQILKKRLGDFDAFTEAVLVYLEKVEARDT